MMMEVIKKRVAELDFPADVKYHQEHTWARFTEDDAVVGISDYAQDQLGDVIFVELPRVGERFGLGQEFGVVESAKSVSTLYIPLAGIVTAVNVALDNSPELINQEPYGAGWILRVKPDTRDAAGALLDPHSYKAMLEGK